MSKKSLTVAVSVLLSGIIAALVAQENSVIIKLVSPQRPKMAVPDFRGSGPSQTFMGAFNETLFSDLQSSGLFDMVAKGMYPLQVPHRPEDFPQPPRPAASAAGVRLSARSSPPANAPFHPTRCPV